MARVTERFTTRALGCGIGGALLALPLHLWMHKNLPGLRVAALGFAGGVVPPLVLATAWDDLPLFLRRGLDAAVAGIGSSDCACSGHFFRFDEAPGLPRFRLAARRAGAARGPIGRWRPNA